MSELISIIVPVYKVEDYIQRCVNSILGQTYKNLEVILVDDGSPDRCGEICDRYTMLDDRVKVIHKKNGGLSDARNVGIEASKGEYIAFVDSDDWIHDKYIEKLYQLLKKTNSDISVCNFIRTSTKGIQIDISKEEIYEYTNVEALGQFVDTFSVQMVVAWGKIYKKNLFEKVRFPMGRIHEDEFTTYKLIYRAKKIVLTTLPLLYYWQREDSIMGVGFNIKHQFDVIDAYKQRAQFFRKAGLEELSCRTYKLLFFIYLITSRRMNNVDDSLKKGEFNNNFKELRNNLRKSKQNFKFKIFYELYYISPKTMDRVYKIYSRIRNQ